MNPVLANLINITSILSFVVFSAAALTWIERRMLGLWQERLGPNRTGPFGVLQVIADMIKLLPCLWWWPLSR